MFLGLTNFTDHFHAIFPVYFDKERSRFFQHTSPREKSEFFFQEFRVRTNLLSIKYLCRVIFSLYFFDNLFDYPIFIYYKSGSQ